MPEVGWLNSVKRRAAGVDLTRVTRSGHIRRAKRDRADGYNARIPATIVVLCAVARGVHTRRMHLRAVVIDYASDGGTPCRHAEIC
jgi:hypothetical protein